MRALSAATGEGPTGRRAVPALHRTTVGGRWIEGDDRCVPASVPPSRSQDRTGGPRVNLHRPRPADRQGRVRSRGRQAPRPRGSIPRTRLDHRRAAFPPPG